MKARGSRVTLVVSDNGPGIAAKDRQHLFERFYRAKTGNPVPGTGLGLYLVKTIVEAHHGSVKLQESDAGARFCVDLPEARGESA